MDPDLELLQQLTDLGNERRANQEAGHQTMLKIANVAPKAIAAGVSKSEVCRRANISFPTLYAILDEN
jgi:hypothetical protein